MASDVEIVNYALSLLGAEAITDLGEESKQAQLARRVFGPVRDAVLRSHPWNCAVARAKLNRLTAAPSHGWDYHYQLPTDPYCLRVLAMNDDQEEGEKGGVFQVEGRRLLTNETAANIRYIKRVTDPNEYDPLLYETIAFRLASVMAQAIGDRHLSAHMWALYLDRMREARTIDGQEGSAEHPKVSTLKDVR